MEARRVIDELDHLRDEEEARVCACGCGRSLAFRRRNVRWFDETCRKRAHRRRVRKALEEAGRPDLISGSGPSTPGANRPVRVRLAEARPRRARKPDLRMPFRRAVDALAAEPEMRGHADPRARADEILRKALPPRLRDRV